jgi:hypothetical protein
MTPERGDRDVPTDDSPSSALSPKVPHVERPRRGAHRTGASALVGEREPQDSIEIALTPVERKPAACHGSVPACISHVAAVCFKVCGVTPRKPARSQAAAKPFLMSPIRSPFNGARSPFQRHACGRGADAAAIAAGSEPHRVACWCVCGRNLEIDLFGVERRGAVCGAPQVESNLAGWVARRLSVRASRGLDEGRRALGKCRPLTSRPRCRCIATSSRWCRLSAAHRERSRPR